jgi:hypothetical protein
VESIRFSGLFDVKQKIDRNSLELFTRIIGHFRDIP